MTPVSDGLPLWRAGAFVLRCGERTHVMGALNVTPDSFSDGGRYLDPGAAVARGLEMAEEGADIVDVGGESTRPGSDPVPGEEEERRTLPVVRRLAAEVDIPISIDTRKPEVARAALEAGASIVNDVSAGSDPRMFDVVQAAGAGLVLMHMRGDPKTMQQHTDYEDVVGEVRSYLRERIDAARTAGIEADRLAVDPGLGFAKTPEQNLLLMNEIGAFSAIGRPVLVGPSRKSFIGLIIDADVSERLEGTAGAVAWMAARGANVVRVHDVKEIVRVVRVVDAIRRAGPPS
jgi:dihydropteroate synthase